MKRLDGIRGWFGRAVIVSAAAFVVCADSLIDVPDAWGSETPGVQQGEAGSELYRWVDRHGVVRYTPQLSRIPMARRDTAVRVVRGTRGRVSDAAAVKIVQPDEASAEVESSDVAADVRPEKRAGLSWPELDARIAALEKEVSADEEIIKEMISVPSGEGGEGVLSYSPELRDIAERLPALQNELIDLRRWRDEPDAR